MSRKGIREWADGTYNGATIGMATAIEWQFKMLQKDLDYLCDDVQALKEENKGLRNEISSMQKGQASKKKTKQAPKKEKS